MSAFDDLRRTIDLGDFGEGIADEVLHDLTRRGMMLHAPPGLRPFLRSTLTAAAIVSFQRTAQAVQVAEMVNGPGPDEEVAGALETTMAAVEAAYHALGAGDPAEAHRLLGSCVTAWQRAHGTDPTGADDDG